jgi:2-amino-4-hydroxy-6-hydroxymethyldihydropteridine diphosphokinase
MLRCYVALGANIGNAVRQVQAAAKAIRDLPEVTGFIASLLYRTAPREIHAPQPDYVNAVVGFDTSLSADVLWSHLSAIETALGRLRNGQRNAARAIDIDLLLFGDKVIRTPTLTVPHPRMTERAFVLAPLLEIAPDASIPGHGSARVFRDRVCDQRVERLETGLLCS